MACCLTAPSHYLNQCWLITSKVKLRSSKGKFTTDTSAVNHWNYLENSLPEIIFKFPRGQWVNCPDNGNHRLSIFVMGLIYIMVPLQQGQIFTDIHCRYLIARLGCTQSLNYFIVVLYAVSWYIEPCHNGTANIGCTGTYDHWNTFGTGCVSNRQRYISQISRCIRKISHNTPLCNRNEH